MSGLVDRITGRVKKAAGDLKDDPKLREQGAREEQKADAKEALARAQREADERAEEVARLERESAGSSGTSATHNPPGATPGDAPRGGNP
jgi:uncharacterized protein YjbJ (UPF0337 family)